MYPPGTDEWNYGSPVDLELVMTHVPYGAVEWEFCYPKLWNTLCVRKSNFLYCTDWGEPKCTDSSFPCPRRYGVSTTRLFCLSHAAESHSEVLQSKHPPRQPNVYTSNNRLVSPRSYIAVSPVLNTPVVFGRANWRRRPPGLTINGVLMYCCSKCIVLCALLRL